MNNTNDNSLKQRHGCVTAWLALMIVANAITSLIYFFASEIVLQKFQGKGSKEVLFVLGFFGIINVVAALLLMRWKKIGFWIFSISSAVILVINLLIGLGTGRVIFGLIGIIILYGILQIKNNGISAWDNLK